MNVAMFIIGAIIFVVYLAGLLYSIWWGHNSQREEMERDVELRDYYNRHHNYDSMDYDGMSNQGRFPAEVSKRRKKKKVK